MRPALTILLMFAAASAAAESTKVAEAGDTAYFIDRASISSSGAIARVPVIHDYARPEPGGVRSRRVLYDVDCGRERLRSVSGAEYSAPMAQGDTLNSWERESEWLYVTAQTGSSIAPRTPYRPIVKFVCSR